MIVPSAEQVKQIEDAREVCLEEDRTFAQTYTVAHPTRIALRAGYFACHLALTLLDTLSQEVERLKNENTELLTRSGKPDDQRDVSIHAATDTKG